MQLFKNNVTFHRYRLYENISFFLNFIFCLFFLSITYSCERVLALLLFSISLMSIKLSHGLIFDGRIVIMYKQNVQCWRNISEEKWHSQWILLKCQKNWSSSCSASQFFFAHFSFYSNIDCYYYYFG